MVIASGVQSDSFEKLKRLKDDLKLWNRSTIGSVEEKIQQCREEIHQLDMIDDVFGLEEQENVRRKKITAQLFLQLNRKNNLQAQKARIKWLKEGNVNSSFFHKVINRQRKYNEIVGMEIEGSGLKILAR